MPTITPPLVTTPFVAGDVLDADRVADCAYTPNTTPTNFGILNGFVDDVNLDLGVTETVDYRMVRHGANGTAKSVGHTTNLDFFADFFEGEYDAMSFDSAVERSLTATGIKFYVPYDCTAVMLSWHVGVVVDGRHVQDAAFGIYEDLDYPTSSADPDRTIGGHPAKPSDYVTSNTLLTLFVDDTPKKAVSRRIITGSSSMLGSTYLSGTALKSLEDGTLTTKGPSGATSTRLWWNNIGQTDHRWWSGHFIMDNVNGIDKGWHTASIRVTNGKWEVSGQTTTLGDPIQKVAPQVRFKTCRFTAIPIR
jgi:hypothetical protein